MIRSLPILPSGTPTAFVPLSHGPAASCADRDTSSVPTLSTDDIAALGTGEGSGLARPAEPNGFAVPAPIHDRARLRAVQHAAHPDITPLPSRQHRQRYADQRVYGGGHKGH